MVRIIIEDLEGPEYDSNGRIKYHPELHFNHGNLWAEEDLEYLCKFSEFDHLESVALALGRTKATVCAKLDELRVKGLINHYKTLNKYWCIDE